MQQSTFNMILYSGLRIKAMLFCILTVHTVYAQPPLERRVSITVNRAPLEKVLQTISTKANFYFAYNSGIIKGDSIVNLSIVNRPVKDVLFVLFQSNYEYKGTGNYIILRRAPVVLKVTTAKAAGGDRVYFIAGYVLDDVTGEKVKDASVYDKQRLVSALTDGNGYFRLKLKSRFSKASLTVSKLAYLDTTITVEPRYNQVVTIPIMPLRKREEIVTIRPDPALPLPDTLPLLIAIDTSSRPEKKDVSQIERTRAGRFFSNSLQRIQSVNLGGFIARRPYQISLTPGLSTHGKLSANVVNSASLNILGGYTAGVKGVEAGGLFNMNKRNVIGAQAAGITNLTGGFVQGAQAAGIFNLVLQHVSGVQAAGIVNAVYGDFTGLQAGGLYNHTDGIFKGVQVAGIANFTGRTVSGVQISGIINYARKLRGVQIGLINIADTSAGFSIGLINIVLKGYHKLSLYSSEALPLNAAFKTGNTNLYSILLGGVNSEAGKKQYSFGYGLGTERSMGKVFSVNPELSCQYIYQGSWNYNNLLSTFSLNLNVHAGRFISLFAGPSFNVYYSNQTASINGYKYGVAGSYRKFPISDLGNTNGWIGWRAGISLF